MITQAVQWTPETNLTAYEWARKAAPPTQAGFLQHVKRIHAKNPPDPGPRTPPDLHDPESTPEFHESTNQSEIHTRSPDGIWHFRITAIWWRDVVCDKISIWHHDLRTMADWTLLLRTRAWVLGDHREAFLWLPDLPSGAPLDRYDNVPANALHLLSPRPVQPSGEQLSTP